MSIYISYHPLDYDFAYKLLIWMRNSGLDAQTINYKESLIPQISYSDEIVAVLRPEYFDSVPYSTILNLLDMVSDFIPILKVPISIEEWSANAVFRPIADFTSLDSESMKKNLNLLMDRISNGKFYNDAPAAKVIYLNDLSLQLQPYLRPFLTLERVNYPSALETELPVHRLLNKTHFKIATISNKHNECSVGYTRTDSLENIARYYKSNTVICNNLDSSSIAYYLVETARKQATIDESAPIPIFLNIEYWPTNISWGDWLKTQASFTEFPIESIASGECVVYLYGLDGSSFNTHPQKSTFDHWFYGNSAPKYVTIICTSASRSDLDNYPPTSVYIEPIEIDINAVKVIGTLYRDRTLSQFILEAFENDVDTAPIKFLSRNPIWIAGLLSVKFDENTDFSQLQLKEYFQLLVENLWSIEKLRNHETLPELTDVESFLSQLAAIFVEQKKGAFSYNNTFTLANAEQTIVTSLDAGFLSINGSTVNFSMPIIQEYFAAKALVQSSVSDKLSLLTLDRQFHRVGQRWDKPVLIFSHLLDEKDEQLKQIAMCDPMLSLICITNGIAVSRSTYTFIMEQNLNSLTVLGDFRIDLSTALYSIDPQTAKVILIEVLRDAHWPIRMDAYSIFIQLEKSYLPGLAEAVSELSNNTKNQVSQALHRLESAALSTLFILLRKDDANVRLNAAWALGELRDKASVAALVTLLGDNDFGVSKQVVTSLGLLQDINCVPYLVKYSRKCPLGLRKLVKTTLTQIHSKLPERFSSQVRAMDASSKRLVIRLLHDSKNADVVDLFLELSFDAEIDVKLDAITELSLHPEPRVISRLEDCLDDMTKSKLTKHTVSEVVSKILSNFHKTDSNLTTPITHNAAISIPDGNSLKSSEVVKARLMQVKEMRLNDEVLTHKLETIDALPPLKTEIPAETVDDSYVSDIIMQLRERTWASSSNAARILREYVKGLHGTASLNVINQILETLNDSDWVIRWTGVETLGWTGNVYVVPHLIQRLTDNNWKIRIAAIRSLSEIGDAIAVTGLSSLLRDSNSVVREAAAEALGLLGGDKALEALESATLDQEDFVRLAVVESLSRLHEKSASKTLLLALKDKSEHVRWAAANGLSGIANETMVPSLIPGLTDTAGPYWEQKRICDVIVDILKQIGTQEALNAIADRGSGAI